MLVNFKYPGKVEDNYFTLRSSISKLFDNFFNPEPFQYNYTGILKNNLFDMGNELLLTVEIPGVSKDNLKISVVDSNITISGERKITEIPSDAKWIKTERFTGSFSKSFRIPSEIDSSNINAEYENGLLKIKLQKSEKAKPKEISINVK